LTTDWVPKVHSCAIHIDTSHGCLNQYSPAGRVSWKPRSPADHLGRHWRAGEWQVLSLVQPTVSFVMTCNLISQIVAKAADNGEHKEEANYEEEDETMVEGTIEATTNEEFNGHVDQAGTQTKFLLYIIYISLR